MNNLQDKHESISSYLITKLIIFIYSYFSIRHYGNAPERYAAQFTHGIDYVDNNKS